MFQGAQEIHFPAEHAQGVGPWSSSPTLVTYINSINMLTYVNLWYFQQVHDQPPFDLFRYWLLFPVNIRCFLRCFTFNHCMPSLGAAKLAVPGTSFGPFRCHRSPGERPGCPHGDTMGLAPSGSGMSWVKSWSVGFLSRQTQKKLWTLVSIEAIQTFTPAVPRKNSVSEGRNPCHKPSELKNCPKQFVTSYQHPFYP
jgi:hypothetical protein